MKTAREYVERAEKSALLVKKYFEFRESVTEEEFELYGDTSALVERLRKEGFDCKEIESLNDIDNDEKPFYLVITPDDEMLTSYDLVVEIFEEAYDFEWDNFIVMY
jgi:hypothetical protein